MIDDGYGNGSYDEVEELLREEEEFFVRNARHALVKRGGSIPEGADEDAIQEARIAAWRSWEKHHNRAYMNIATRQRLVQHVFRDQWFGTSPRAHEMDPIRRKDRDSFDDPDFETVVLADQHLDVVLLAYHYGEIVQAINTLTPGQREYVVLRFWNGMTNAEIAAERGTSISTVRSAWNRHIRPALMEHLSHLEGVLL